MIWCCCVIFLNTLAFILCDLTGSCSFPDDLCLDAFLWQQSQIFVVSSEVSSGSSTHPTDGMAVKRRKLLWAALRPGWADSIHLSPTVETERCEDGDLLHVRPQRGACAPPFGFKNTHLPPIQIYHNNMDKVSLYGKWAGKGKLKPLPLGCSHGLKSNQFFVNMRDKSILCV